MKQLLAAILMITSLVFVSRVLLVVALVIPCSWEALKSIGIGLFHLDLSDHYWEPKYHYHS